MSAKKKVARSAASAVRRMVGGAAAAMCPPGVWCMDTGVVVLAVVLLGILAVIMYQIHLRNGSAKSVVVVSAPAPVPAPVPEPPQPVVVPPPVIVQQQAPSDPRFFPTSPEQLYNTPPDVRGFPTPPLIGGGGGSVSVGLMPIAAGIPINQMTRGYPDQYQQVGVLTAPGGSETSASPTRTILPLFGRKLITNRDRWNYYTRTDGMNPVQVPVEFKRRKCDDDNGCDEIMDGDNVAAPILGQSFVANVYRYSTPRYIPF
jgi:hypothetical protein